MQHADLSRGSLAESAGLSRMSLAESTHLDLRKNGPQSYFYLIRLLAHRGQRPIFTLESEFRIFAEN